MESESSVTVPMTQDGRPRSFRRATAASAASGDTMATMPTPRLRVRSRSGSGTFPGGAVHRGYQPLREDPGQVGGQAAAGDVAEAVDGGTGADREGAGQVQAI